MSGGERRWDGGESGERLMNAADQLERAYGRLLRWYPAGHRARHADEMLGVLMAGAGSGRRRPGLADSADLIGGALRIRLRAATTGSAGLWREALGRAGVLLPLAWAVLIMAFVDRQIWIAGLNPSVLTAYAQEFLPPLAVLITVLLGWRRVALAAIAAAVIFGSGDLELRYLIAPRPYDATYLAVLGIAALALVAAPGRARARLTAKHYLLTVAAAVPAGVAAQYWPFLVAGWPAGELAGLAVVAAVTVLLLAGSAASRRLLIVSAVPLYCQVAFIVTTSSWRPSPLLDLPLVALAGVAVLLAVRWARTCLRAAAGAGGSASRAAGG
jgi:hypothetical protein